MTKFWPNLTRPNMANLCQRLLDQILFMTNFVEYNQISISGLTWPNMAKFRLRPTWLNFGRDQRD